MGLGRCGSFGELGLVALLAAGCEGAGYGGPSRLELADSTASLREGGPAAHGSFVLRVQAPLSAPRDTEIWLHDLSVQVSLPFGQQLPVADVAAISSDTEFPLRMGPGRLAEATVDFDFEIDAELAVGLCAGGAPTAIYQARIYDSLAYYHDPNGVDAAGLITLGSGSVEVTGATTYPSQRAFPVVWEKTLAPSGAQNVTDMDITADGELLLGGTFISSLTIPGTGPLGDGTGIGNGFLAKMDADGKAVWSLGLAALSAGVGVATSPDGGLVAAGNTTPGGELSLGRLSVPASELPTAWVGKVSPTGKPIYLAALRPLDAASIVTVEPGALAVDNAGNAHVVGGLKGSVDFAGGISTSADDAGMFLLALDPAGAVASYKLIPTNQPLNVLALEIDPAGGAVVGGWTGTPALELGGEPLEGSGVGVVIARYDAAGSLVFGRRFDVLDHGGVEWFRLAVDAQGRTYAAGVVTGRVQVGGEVVAAGPSTFLIALEPTGEVAWTKTLALGSVAPVDVAVAGDRVLATVGFLGELQGDWGDPLLAGPALEARALVELDRQGTMSRGAAIACDAGRAVVAARPGRGDVVVAVDAPIVDFGGGVRQANSGNVFISAMSLSR